MADAKEKTISLLSYLAGCNLNAAGGTDTAIYVAPSGKTLIVDHVVMHTFSADTVNAVVTFGITGGACEEFLGNVTLSNVTASYATQVIKACPVPSMTPPVFYVVQAAQTFGMQISTAAGSACTCTVEVWGHLI